MEAEHSNQKRREYGKTALYVKAAPGLKLRDKRVERLARKMRQVMSWLEPSDYPAARAWAELEYLAGQVYASLRNLGVLNSKGDARRLLEDYWKLRQTQVVLARELGMTPAARMSIRESGRHAPLDLASAFAQASQAETEEAVKVTTDGADPVSQP